jgi:hypothetical protein
VAEESNPTPAWELNCILCGLPVSLATAKTDGYGKPVHEACLVRELSKKRPA